MKDKITKESCSHNFEYSHQETIQQNGIGIGSTCDSSGLLYKKVDVTVCSKCGEIRRN